MEWSEHTAFGLQHSEGTCFTRAIYRMYFLIQYKKCSHADLHGFWIHNLRKPRYRQNSKFPVVHSVALCLQEGQVKYFMFALSSRRKAFSHFYCRSNNLVSFHHCCVVIPLVWAIAVAMLYFSKLISVFWIITHISEMFSDSYSGFMKCSDPFTFLHVLKIWFKLIKLLINLNQTQ